MEPLGIIGAVTGVLALVIALFTSRKANQTAIEQQRESQRLQLRESVRGHIIAEMDDYLAWLEKVMSVVVFLKVAGEYPDADDAWTSIERLRDDFVDANRWLAVFEDFEPVFPDTRDLCASIRAFSESIFGFLSLAATLHDQMDDRSAPKGFDDEIRSTLNQGAMGLKQYYEIVVEVRGLVQRLLLGHLFPGVDGIGVARTKPDHLALDGHRWTLTKGLEPLPTLF